MPFNLKPPPSQETFVIDVALQAREIIPDPKTNRLTFEFIASAVGQYALEGTENVALTPSAAKTLDSDRLFQVTVGIGTARLTNPVFVQILSGTNVSIRVIAEE